MPDLDPRRRPADASPESGPSGPPCPLCGSSEGGRIYTEPWIAIRRCSGCGFLFTEDREGDFRTGEAAQEIDEFYRWLQETGEERVPLLEERLRWMVERFGLPDGPLRVLEVGTGGGALLRACAAQGHRYTGLEPLLGARFEKLAEEGGPGIEILPARLEEFDSREPFDVAVMDNVLEHLPRPVEAVGKVLSLLEPHGVLWIQVPNEASLLLKHRLFSLFKDRRITFPGHVNLFTRASLEACLRAAGARETVLDSTSASHPVLTRLLLMRPRGVVLRAVMATLRWTRLDVRLGRGYWLDAYALPPVRTTAEP